MRFQYVFYVLGIIFSLVTITYFTYEYGFKIPKEIKTGILILLVIVFYLLGDYLRERAK